MKNQNKVMLLLALGALVILSGCITENDVSREMCLQMDQTHGVRELNVCSYEMHNAYANQFANECGYYPATCNWGDVHCFECELVRQTLFDTGFLQNMFYFMPYHLVHYQCSQSGTVGEIFHVSFTDAGACPEACLPSNPKPSVSNATCANFDCTVPEGDPRYLACFGTTPVCNRTTGNCRRFDCRPLPSGYGDVCEPPSVCGKSGQCQGAPPETCADAGRSVIVQPFPNATIYGQTLVKVAIDGEKCYPTAVHVKIDNTEECATANYLMNGHFLEYQCTINADNGYQDGSHQINVTAVKGTKTIRLQETVQICNDDDHQCNGPNQPTCPSQCQLPPNGTYNPTEVTCNSYPAICCKDPSAGACSPSDLKDVCQTQSPPAGTYCSNGGECLNGNCSCPSTCTLPPADEVDCGTLRSYPAGINCPSSAGCNPGIGTKCPDDRLCSTRDGDTQARCWSRDGAVPTINEVALQCGSIATVEQAVRPPDKLEGLYCPNQPNPTKLCDSTTNQCLSILDSTQFPPKFSFDLKTSPDSGLLYNLWFYARLDPQNDQSNVPMVSLQKIECMDCANQPSEPSNWLGVGYNQAASKEGLIPFELENKQLFGSNNYALVTVTDEVNLNKNANAKSTEKFILKINAGYSGECVPEDRSFQGKTGLATKPNIKFDWDWKDLNSQSQLKQCNSDNPSGFYCDSTQFLMSLFSRLETMRDLAKNGNPAGASALQAEWDVNLMKDGFTADFLKDFSDYESSSQAFAPSWLPPWLSYSDASTKMTFVPNQITEPGRYRVQLGITWQAGDWTFFNADEQPQTEITVHFTKIADAYPANPFYSLPFDSDIGATARTDELVPDRQGYGTALLGETLPLLENYSAAMVGSANGGITVNELSGFSFTNPIEQRGKLLTIDLQSNGITFSPVTATPIIMKVDSGSGTTAQAFYSIASGMQSLNLSSDETIAAWSGIGSKNLPINSPNPCKGFTGDLFFRRADAAAPSDSSCLGGNTNVNNSRGFFWNDVSRQQAVFLKTIVYFPQSQSSAVLTNECSNSSMTWISPGSTTESANALALNYTPATTPAIQINTVKGILNAVDSGYVCQHTSIDNKTVSYYWNRSKLESDLNAHSSNIITTAQKCPSRN